MKYPITFFKKINNSCSTKPNAVNINDSYIKAKKLFNKRLWDATQKTLQKSLLEVKTAKAYHLLGLALYHQGCFQNALQEFKNACKLKQTPEYLLNLSIVLNELGQYTEAQKIYQKVTNMNTQSSQHNWQYTTAKKQYELGNSYFKEKQFKLALKEYVKSSKCYFHPEVELQIVHTLWNLNKRHTAKKYLKKFISLCPQNKKAHLLLAQWYFKEKQLAETINTWNMF